MERLPTEEEYLDWLSHPVTKAFRRLLEEGAKGLMEQWAEGSLQSSDPHETQAASLQALGQLKIYRQLKELDYEQFTATFDRGDIPVSKPVRTSPLGASRID